ncbi:P-type conjugative transfer protein TrbG, partial [Agrobacterium tumefaciens]|nr:P-type conjugative transfer protein TrbG [Agrobacterium tumefaciens]
MNIQLRRFSATLTAATIVAAIVPLSASLSSRALAADGVTANEAKGMGISGQWRGSRGLVTKGPDGKVIFLYGEVQPSVVCSPLQVCDIELQGGEVVRDVLVGDTVRWKVEP